MKLWQLIQALEDDIITAESYDGVSDVVFVTDTGWRIEVFMDCGAPDYMHWAETPKGERFYFWAQPIEHNKHNDAINFIAGNVTAMLSDRLLTAARKLHNWDY